MHSNVYQLNRERGGPGKKYTCALDTEPGEVTSARRSWERLWRAWPWSVSLVAEAGWGLQGRGGERCLWRSLPHAQVCKR